jgi:hypothetical protein
MKRGLGTLLALVAIGMAAVAAGDAAVPPHAYYLFLAGAPQGCEDCYVPLLVAEGPLEELAALGGHTTIVLITTYERDSIWKVERGLTLAAADIAPGERAVRLRGRRYRYQEIGPAEVLRLLKRPEGSIPIHRIMPVPSGESLEDLISAFRAGK